MDIKKIIYFLRLFNYEDYNNEEIIKFLHFMIEMLEKNKNNS